MKFFFKLFLCLFLITFVSCQSEEIQEPENTFLKTEILYLDGKKIEIDTYTDDSGTISMDEENKIIINNFLEANPNYTSIISAHDNALRFFKNEKDKDEFKASMGFKKTIENNYLQSKTDFLIIDEGGSGGGGSSYPPLLNVKTYEHINIVGLLDNWNIYGTSLQRRYFSYINSNNMNDKISSFIVSDLANGFSGVSFIIYKDDIGSSTDREFIIPRSYMPFIASNLSWYWMSGTAWWEKSWNDQVSSYEVIFY